MHHAGIVTGDCPPPRLLAIEAWSDIQGLQGPLHRRSSQWGSQKASRASDGVPAAHQILNLLDRPMVEMFGTVAGGVARDLDWATVVRPVRSAGAPDTLSNKAAAGKAIHAGWKARVEESSSSARSHPFRVLSRNPNPERNGSGDVLHIAATLHFIQPDTRK